VPEDLALRLASLPALTGAPDAVLVAEKSGRPISEAAATLFATAEYFGLNALRTAAAAIVADDHYERLVLDRAFAQIDAAGRAIAIKAAWEGSGPTAIESWVGVHPSTTGVRKIVGEISSSGANLARISVIASMLNDLADA
jgi:glutamate dehydrogenase